MAVRSNGLSKAPAACSDCACPPFVPPAAAAMAAARA